MNRRQFIAWSGAGLAAASLPRQKVGAAAVVGGEIEGRIAKILPQLSLDEKVSLMSGVLRNTLGEIATSRLRPGQGHGYTGYTVGVKRLGIPRIKCLDGPRGVGFFYQTTCFPVGMARGATFDPVLEEKVGEVMGYEARALGANMLLAPCINLLWHPRWGRAQESYGEDPHQLGAMGAAFTRGVQKHVMACVKHFAVNNVEDTRMKVDAMVDERTLQEVFLPHFHRCVEAKAASFMSSYNHLNGPKAGQNKRLVREILKQQWGFEGFLVSDWITAVDNTVEAANAGLDLEMPRAAYFGGKLKTAVKEGKVPEAAIDEAVTRMLRQLFRFVTPDYEKGYTQKEIAGTKHAAVAREVVRKSAVLLKNQGPVLPFSGLKSLAVLGRLGKEDNLGDRGSSRVSSPHVITMLEGIKQKAGGIQVSYGGESISEAKALAAKADAVVVVAGLGYKDEGEGHDREGMTLPPDQIELIRAAAGANRKCAVVLVAGSAVTMEGWLDEVPALLLAWYPGMEGGAAVAEILFGEVNPSGKLPIVFPKREDQLFPFENKALKVEYKGFHGYRWFDDKALEPLFPFGFGLSYTEFKFGALKLSAKEISKSGKLTVSVEVANTGKVAGEEVVQVYVGCLGSKVPRPKKELKAFTRVKLDPNETKTVSLEIPASDLAYYDVASTSWVVEPIEYQVLAGPSSRESDLLKDKFKVLS